MMALVLLLVNLVVSYLIWSPFISSYERRLEADAQKEGETTPDGPN
jgi:cellobiose-specific phosphotransferase system component IIC